MAKAEVKEEEILSLLEIREDEVFKEEPKEGESKRKNKYVWNCWWSIKK